MWLSREFLDWYAFVQSDQENEDKDREGANRIWMHAEEILMQYHDELHLVDAVTSLKRAMSHRLNLIEKTYSFGRIPVGGQPRRTIEQLAFWGIVRPTMLIRLIEIRNAVEHENVSPPPHERCLELLDFVWYFLRSTDRLVLYTPQQVVFAMEVDTDGDYTYSVVLEADPPKSWQLDFGGWINVSLLSQVEQKNWFQINVNKQKTRDEVRKWDSEAAKAHAHRRKDDVWIEGTIMGPERPLRELLERYFRLALAG